MADLIDVVRSYPWLVALAILMAIAFLGVLLWKILRSEEGFLLGYGNWIVGKWQTRGQSDAVSVASAEARVALEVRQTADSSSPKAAPTPRHDISSLKRSLQLQDSVLTLSRMLDGDLAYLMMNDATEWGPKILRSIQTLVSGVTRVVHPTGHCRCGLFVLDETEQNLVLAVGEGYGPGKQPKLGLDRSCAGRAFLTGEDYYCRDIVNDPVYWHSGTGNKTFRSIACVPVRAGQAVFGVVCLDAEQANAFTQEDFSHLEVFAAKLAVFCAFHALQVGVCSVDRQA
jgi:putative methionine-R-sulfoxide reductase with GAF domain